MSTEPEPKEQGAPEDERQMPFLAHLGELRGRLRWSAVAYFVAVFVCYGFAMELFALLVSPLIDASTEAGIRPTLNFLSPIEPFWVLMKISMIAAIFVASPVIFWQFWKFVAPGLYKKERRVAIPVVVSSATLFCGGALFGHQLVLPAAFKFFLGFASKDLGRMKEVLGRAVDLQLTRPFDLNPMLGMEQVVGFSTKMLLAFGAVFELPLVLSLLSFFGVVSARTLWKFNRYALVICSILGAVLTPGPDVASMLMMALPMWLLYNISVLIAFVFDRRRARAQADG